ncbi:sensor histidine kinase [Flavobacterium frigoris]|uniref:histidine kinase n=1 Tax=Flavobacterium frigoris (strain PS1) TaxID=1086011 RepID=H7FUE0_FLAFP|nr:HAMP domain-containing sensor histidine kinase [Flavobacterium frigoris]EIA07817.1 two-component sensor histidine kinase [Flavobacterium frigoris PS1]
MKELKSNYEEELNALKKEYEEFVYIVSHDIKTPMRAIVNIANWIEDDLGSNVDQDILDNFSLLKNRVGRLENMMNALLEISRINSTKMEVYEVNIPKLVNDCVEMLDNRSNVEFHIAYHIKDEKCITLGKKLEKVVFSLLDNAIRFHDKEKKNVTIEVIENDIDYIFSISDDGPGIPEEVQDKIFSIFYTVNSKDVVDTTGAGLTISNRILKVVGGTLEYAPTINKGSLFKFNWPKTISR